MSEDILGLIGAMRTNAAVPYVTQVTLTLVLAMPLSAQWAEGNPFLGERGGIDSGRIHAAVPTLANYYWDEGCNFVVLLADLRWADSARAIYAPLVPQTERFKGRTCSARPGVRVLRARFTQGEIRRVQARLMLETLHGPDAGETYSMNDSTQELLLTVKNEAAAQRVRRRIAGDTALVGFPIRIRLREWRWREHDGPVLPPGDVYLAALRYLKFDLEPRYNEMARRNEYEHRMRLECVVMAGEVPDYVEADLSHLGLRMHNCQDGQTIRLHGARKFVSGAYALRTSFAGYCGELLVEPRRDGWSTRFASDECPVVGR